MTNYLLSDGTVTSDIIDYAIDYIKVSLFLGYDDVPYSSFGNTMDLAVNMKSEVLYQVRMTINSAIAKLNSDYAGLNASLNNIEFRSDDRLVAEITMSNYKVELAI